MKNRLSAMPAFKAIQTPLLKSSKGQSLELQMQLSAYGTMRLLAGPGFKLKNVASTKDPLGAAIATLNTHKTLLGLGSQDTLQGSSGIVKNPTSSLVHLRQLHLGVPVYGGGVTVNVDSNGDIRSLFNSTIPDITQSAIPKYTSTNAKSTLTATHGAISAFQSELFYRKSGQQCDTADLAWKISYTTKAEDRVAWVNAATGNVVVDSPALTVVTSAVEVKTQQCSGGGYTTITSCNQTTCQGSGDAYNACVWSRNLWDYWANASIHGATARMSYDAHSACMKTVIECSSGQAGGYDPCSVSPDYTTKGVIAHEFGHGLIANACEVRDPVGCNMDLRPNQAAPVYEHIADMQAAAIDNIWWIKAKNHKVRDWEDPTRVTTVGTMNARFPTNFDDYNYHSIQGSDNGYYTSWHVPSTVWSHLIYNLAHKPGMNRSTATEVVYRTLVNRMEHDDDFSFTGYAHHMREEAAVMGYGSVVEEVQIEAKLWMPAEIVFPYCYTRPAIVSGPLVVEPWSIEYLHVFYNEYNYNLGTDKLLVARKSSIFGTWYTSDTGLSPYSVGGSITATYDAVGSQYFIAWPTWYGTVEYSRRSDQSSGTWTSLQSVPAVSTNDDVAVVAGSGMIRLYFRDATTGKLRFVKWTGTTWSVPMTPPTGFDVALTGGPSATWDGYRFQLTYMTSNGNSGILQITPGATNDTWNEKDTFSSCFFQSQASEHTWQKVPVAVNNGGALYMIGPSTELLDGYSEIQQVRGFHPRGSSKWNFNDHGNLERVADAVDATFHSWDSKIWAVGFTAWPYNTASVFWKKP